LQPSLWAGLSTELWWKSLTSGDIPSWKAIASLALLVFGIWSERKARVVFGYKFAPHVLVIVKIKKESLLWVIMGAKRLGDLMPRE
jgi:hypothetical protein